MVLDGKEISSSMHIVFRADASLAIGNGHVMRCASLAQALHANGAHCTFVCTSETGHLNAYLQNQGYVVHAINPNTYDTRVNTESLLTNWQSDAQATANAIHDQHIDWVVVDHYGLDWQWEAELSSYASQLMVIDDLANREHQCALLLDANPGRQVDDYDILTPLGCRILTGPKYALIRNEIRQSRHTDHVSRVTHTSLRILITLGGVDNDNFTCKVLAALNQFDSNTPLEIQVVVGPFAPWIDQVFQISHAMRWPTHVTQNPNNFIELMCTHDIAIGAAGTSALERCYLGLPSINFILAPNQHLSAKTLQTQHAASSIELNTGWEESLHQHLHELQKSSHRQAMQKACLHITDGSGAELVAQEMLHA